MESSALQTALSKIRDLETKTDALSRAVLDVSPANYYGSLNAVNNLLTYDEATFEGVNYWTAGANSTGLTISTTEKASGTSSLRVTSNAGGTLENLVYLNRTIPVTAGQSYSAVTSAKTSSSTFQSVGIRVEWYNASNTLISDTTGFGIATVPAGSWQDRAVTATAPVGSVYAKIVLLGTAVPTGVFLYFDHVVFRQSATAAMWDAPAVLTRTVGATIVPWTQLPLQGNTTGTTGVGAWWNYAAPYGPAQYCKDATGTVTIKGLIQYTNSVGSTTIVPVGGLPVGCRPNQQLLFNVLTSGGYARVDVCPDGSIIQSTIALNSYVSLSLSFKAQA